MFIELIYIDISPIHVYPIHRCRVCRVCRVYSLSLSTSNEGHSLQLTQVAP